MLDKFHLEMPARSLIPREHGAWAVLLVPLVIGTRAGGGWDWLGLCFTLSVLGAFLSYLPAQTLLRRKFSFSSTEENLRAARHSLFVALSLAILFLLPVLIVGGRWLLLPLAAVSVVCFFFNFILTKRQSKTIPSDLAAVLGLTATAPGAFYVASGRLGTEAFLLWLLNVFFFGSCVFYVHMRIRALASKKNRWGLRDRLAYGGTNLIYHLVMVGILILLALERVMPSLQLLAFAPMTITALWGTTTLVSETNLRKVGFMLLTHSVLFMIVFSIPLH
jgi:hypothetical protein